MLHAIESGMRTIALVSPVTFSEVRMGSAVDYNMAAATLAIIAHQARILTHSQDKNNNSRNNM